MKKVLVVVAILLVLLVGFFLFSGGGRDVVSNFFNENTDFGSFFDTEPISNNDFVATPGVPATSTPVQTGPYQAPILRQISFEPVSGYTFYATTSTSTITTIIPERGEVEQTLTSTSTVVRFQERASGHVYDVFEFILTPQKVSNITVQKVYASLFTNDTNAFFMQSPTFNNELVRTSLGRIVPAKPETTTASSTQQTLGQSDISSTISNLAYIPATNKILYSTRTGTGSSILTSNVDRSGETRVASLSFSEFTVDPLNATQALVQTKASSNVRGYAYTLTLSNGSLNKLLGGIPGLLVKASPDLKYYIYSESTLNRPIIRGYDSTTGTTRQIGIQTIPEKCVFTKTNSAEALCFGSSSYISARYPEDWYMGKVFNKEDLYRVNFSNGAVENVYTFGSELEFDIINPKLSPNEDMIAFQNKYDLTLWALDLDALDNEF